MPELVFTQEKSAAGEPVVRARFELAGFVVKQKEWFALATMAREHGDGALRLLDGGVVELSGVSGDESQRDALREKVSDLAASLSPADTPFAEEGQHSGPPIGWLADGCEDGKVNLGAGIQDRWLPADYVDLLGVLDAPVAVTRWGSLVICDIAEGDADVVLRVLAPRGFIFDANSPHLDD